MISAGNFVGLDLVFDLINESTHFESPKVLYVIRLDLYCSLFLCPFLVFCTSLNQVVPCWEGICPSEINRECKHVSLWLDLWSYLPIPPTSLAITMIQLNYILLPVNHSPITLSHIQTSRHPDIHLLF